MTTLKILQLTDLHILPHAGDTMLGIDTEYYFKQTLQHAHAHHGPFDLILLTGDLAQDPCSTSYHRIKTRLETYLTPCLCLPGNHDDSALMMETLHNGLVSCDKHKVFSDWQIIALNSQKPGSPVGLLADSELDFLEKILQAESNLPTLIAMHHPCVASDSDWLDTMQIENSDTLLAIIGRFANVKAIVFGHIHQELSARVGNLAVYATPSSCFQFTPNSKEFSIDLNSPGYRVLELYSEGRFNSHCHRIPEQLLNLDRNAHSY